jgi:hypothetical protein
MLRFGRLRWKRWKKKTKTISYSPQNLIQLRRKCSAISRVVLQESANSAKPPF